MDTELTRLIAALGSPDPADADAAGFELLRQGGSIVPALLASFPTLPSGVRRRVVFLLGRIEPAAEFAGPLRQTLEAALGDEDWKVRRNAAISLGKLEDPAATASMLDRLDTETDARVRPSIMLALGKTAGVDMLPRLRALSPTDPAEVAAMRKSLHSIEGRAGRRSVIAPDAAPSGVPVELWTRAGVADIALEEASSMGIAAAVVAADRVRIEKPDSLAALIAVRSALYPVLVFEAPRSMSDPVEMGRAFDASPAARFIRAVTEAPATYRLSVALDDPRYPRRSDWIDAFSSACSLENRATAYAWEVVVRRSGGVILFGARPAAMPDDRFSYRTADVPASLHPTLAAAAVRLLPVSDDDVIVDPFCGAGTLLAERAIRGGYRALRGIDNNPRALDAARTNLASFDRVTLEQDDFSRLESYSPIDVILTNPPYGRRVGNPAEAGRLHERLDRLAARALKPGGWFIVMRPAGMPVPASLEIVSRRQVDAGGFDVQLIAARRPR